jgi:hypothetical protein
MTVATVIDIPIMRHRLENNDNAVHRHSGYDLFHASHAFFPIFGVLLGAMAMTSVFIIERSALFIGA